MKAPIPGIVGKHRHILQVLLIRVIRGDIYLTVPHLVLQIERRGVMSDVGHNLHSINVVRFDIRSLSIHQQKLSSHRLMNASTVP